MAAAVVVFVQLRGQENRHAAMEFRRLAEQNLDAIAETVAEKLFVLEAVHSAYDASSEITRSEFAAVAEPYLRRYPHIQALEWIPRVPVSKRAQYELLAREDGFEEFQIVDWASEGETDRSPTRNEYFPAYYVEPYRGNEADVGIDLATRKPHARAMAQARDTGQVAGTASPAGDDGQTAEQAADTCFQLFVPIYDRSGLTYSTEQRREHLRGFVLGVFRTGALIEDAIAPLTAEDISVCVSDTTADGPSIPLFPTGKAAVDQNPTEGTVSASSSSLSCQQTISVGGRSWLARCVAEPGFTAARTSSAPWMALVGGLVLTGMLAVWLLTLIGRTARIEELVSRRTAELADANTELKREVSERKQIQGDLRESLQELERHNRAMMGREKRVLELKAQVNSLLGESGREQVFGEDEQTSEQHGAPQVAPCTHPEGRIELRSTLDRVENLSALLTSYCESVGVAAAIINLEGQVLVGARWQRICTDFHRKHPETCRKCVESDTIIANQIREGERFSLYTCRNGLTDAAAPITVHGQHVANLFVGQFLLEPPNLEFFRRQAVECGFPEDEYLSALADVPILDRRRLEHSLEFLSKFAVLLGTMETGQSSLREANANLHENRQALLSMMEDVIEAREKAEEYARKAESANQAKSEFLANMSHEIRTPMTAILGFADVLLECGDLDNAPPHRIEAAETIKRNGEYLLGVINDILDLSKVEAGKMSVEHIACSPCGIVAEIASLMNVKANARGLVFKVEYAGAVPETINTDPLRLRQILINMIGNAIKFTDAGSVSLVTRWVDEADHPFMQFDVVDTGIGMTEEQTGRLFTPFTQADTSTTRRFGGTGLGLAISKRFAQMLGGDIAVVDSQPGAGTRMRVTVATGPTVDTRMIADPRAATTVTPESPGPHADGASPSLEGYRILLAEDGPDNQRLISYLIRKAGAQITVVENGRLAADAALAARDGAEPFDVVLMDMQMPVMDGYEATRLLRRDGYAAPIIALTAHAMASDRDKCLKAGCDDYAVKPINRVKLIETILNHVSPQPSYGR